MERLHQANAYGCFLVGGSLNLILLWLIVKKSNDELRVYSIILLQSAVINLVYLLLYAVCVPVRGSSELELPSTLANPPHCRSYSSTQAGASATGWGP